MSPGIVAGPSMAFMAQALCAQPRHRTLPWIEDPNRLEARRSRPVMAALCDACPVRANCEAFAEAAKITAGFWAGEWRTLADARPPALGEAA